MTQTAATPADLNSVPPASGARAQFLDAYRREHAVTRTVLIAFPAHQSEFTPHERSSSARQLAWTMVAAERAMMKALANEPVLGSGFPPAPESWGEVLAAFDARHDDIIKLLETSGESVMNGKVGFYTGPKQVGEFSTADFVWLMLYDQIHHRGQLSVYLRMAGGNVPSIYGPSADEPWT
jgi:uncharacterized damage-inducible protein DinB